MIKSFFLSQAMLCLCFTSLAQKSARYIISGKVNDYATYKDPVKIYLSKGIDLDKGVLYDSADMIKGVFHFSGTITEPGPQTIMMKHPGTALEDKLTIWLDEGKLNISTRKLLKDAVLEGPPFAVAYPGIEAEITKLQEKNDSLYRQRKKLDTLRARLTDERFNSYVRIIRKYPASSFSGNLLTGLLITAHEEKNKEELTPEKLRLLEELNQLIQQSQAGSPLAIELDITTKGLRANGIGDPLVHFTLPDMNGKPINSQSLQGKVFLVDFWGSWCIWCRKGHPHLKQLYEKYRSKGFEIIAITKEFGNEQQQLEKWKRAVQEDQLPWIHLINGEGKNNIVQAFGVSAYPTKILVDKNGNIVLRVNDDAEKKLDAKLAELLN